MEKVKVGRTLTYWFTTHDASSGQVTDADTLPSAAVFEDTTTTAIVTPTVTKPAGTTGRYYFQVVATAGNGFEAGKSYNVLVAATVSTVTGECVIDNFECTTSDIDDVSTFDSATDTVTLAATTHTGAVIPTVTTATTTTTVTNTVNANVTQISGDTVAADNLELDYDGTGFTKANSTVGTVTTVTNAVTAGTVSDKTGYELSATGVDAIWDEVMESLGTDNETARQIMKLVLAVLGGNSAGGGTTTVDFKRGDGSTLAIQATVDTDGNRTVTAKTL